MGLVMFYYAELTIPCFFGLQATTASHTLLVVFHFAAYGFTTGTTLTATQDSNNYILNNQHLHLPPLLMGQ